MGAGKIINQSGLKTSPWLIIGASALLLTIVLVGAVQNTRREKRYMSQVLTTKGAALIRGVEAGARTGMMGMMWGGAQVQRLIEETAQLPDVLYMAVIDRKGTVLAHSDASRIGEAFRSDQQLVHLGPQNQENWELVDLPNGQRAFEVHRYFRPLPSNWRRHSRQMGPMMRSPRVSADNDDWFNPQTQTPPIIIVGLDMTPFKQSMANDFRQTVLLSVAMVLLGFAGMVSLFWMQSYRSARKSWEDTSAVADNVVAHLPVGLIATDQSGHISFFNGAAAQLTGISQGEALGQAPKDILPSNLCDLENLLANGKPIVEMEMEYQRTDQTSIPVSISATKIINDQDQELGHVLILRDLREVRRLEEAVRRQEKLAALGGLAAGVAHEIRNPLSSIKGLATYFAAKTARGSEDRRVAQVMTQEVDRLNRVISELLEFARPTDIKPKATDINELIQHSLKLIQPDAASKKIEIEQHLQDDLCRAQIDPDRLSQCLLNVYLNAFDAMPNGGKLIVESVQGEADTLLIRIVDTGSGMRESDLERVFNPYYTTKPKGTGLGLPIVHKIVTAHEGRIQVDSTPGKGTRFELMFPCHHKEA